MNAVTGQDDKQGVGRSIAQLSATTLDGQDAPLGDYVGQKVVLDFWATWCGPCREQRNTFAGMDPSFFDQVKLVSLSVDESAQVVSDFLNKEQEPAPAIDLMATSALEQMFQVKSIPTLVFVDSTGIVREIRTGMQSAAQVRKIVESMK